MFFFVTGGTGFIGQRLVRVMRERGHRVRALVRRASAKTALASLGVEVVEGDLVTGAALDKAVHGVDAVMHLAGLTKARTADDYFRGNALGTRNLAAAVARMPHPARFVYCSSLAAAGPSSLEQPRVESDPPAPVSTYGKSKLAGEAALRDYVGRFEAVVVRPPIVYGPADKEFLPSVLPMAKLGWVLKSGFGPKRYSMIHVDDLCDALLAAAERGKPLSATNAADGVYFVSDEREYTWEEFSSALAQALGRGTPRMVSVPNAVSYAVGLGSELGARVRGSVPILNRDKVKELAAAAWTCSPARAKAEIDYAPKFPLQAGLDSTVQWFREEGLL
ncbi:MAG: NAD-dependent epimerase/dehydratase family protein [Myxococcaceae bacterium]